VSRPLGSLKLTDVVLLTGDAGGGLTDTDDLPEGSTNLYYTNARVAAYLTGLSGTDTSATFLRGDNTWDNRLTGDFRVDGKVGFGAAPLAYAGATVGGAYTAAIGSMYGLALDTDLTAGANADTLIGWSFTGSFNSNAKTGLTGHVLQFSAATDANFSETKGIHSSISAAAGTAYAIYGAVSGAAPTKWAGYFGAGDVKIENRLDVAGGLNVGTATGAATGQVKASASVLAVQPAARVTHNTTQSVLTGTVTNLIYNTEDYDTDAIHDPATNSQRLTCKTAGKYLVACNMDWSNFTGGNRRQTAIYKNGGAAAFTENPPPASASQYLQQALSKIIGLAVNDYVEMRVYQDSGGTYTVPATANGLPDFAMSYLGN
jgi:hypothetical protein